MTKVSKPTSYRKLKKLERNKVKIKSHKTILPKGQNVTDTNFRVKKVIIKDQVHPHKEGEVLTKRKLSCQELLVRLNHHNVGMKLDALSGLKELVTEFPQRILEHNLAPLINSVSKLNLDESKDVRKEANILLAIVLSQVSACNLSPLFPSLCSYLICGITHIDTAIREDSLFLLDSLLKWTPSLCANAAPKLLPICLDLVSSTTANSRTLSVNLESKFTTGMWRGNVLARISTLLSVLLGSYKESSQFEEISTKKIVNASTMQSSENGKLFIPLYQSNISYNFEDYKLFMTSFAHESVDTSKFSVKTFTEALIPLLFEAFIEIIPLEENILANRTSTNISVNVFMILKHIVDIVNTLWQLISTEQNSTENKKWFKNKFSKSFMNSLITDRFPYTVTVTEEDKKRKRQLPESTLTCNILLSKLVLNLTDPPMWYPVILFLKNCLRASDTFSPHECCLLISCCKIICMRNGENTRTFLSNLCQLSNSQNNNLSYEATSALYDIVSDNKLSYLYNDEYFQDWLNWQPHRLIKPSISSKVLDILYNLARRKLPAFYVSLGGLIEAILDNLPNIIIDDGHDNLKGHIKIAQLLYWVQDWDDEMLESLQKAIAKNYWGTKITNQINDIYRIKFQNATRTHFDLGLENNDHD